MVPADCLVDTTTDDILELSQTLNYESSEIEAARVRVIPIETFSWILTLDFSDLPAGFYRIFFEQASGEINWENIYLNPNFSGIYDLAFLDSQCD